jgi:dihydropteroate synthase
MKIKGKWRDISAPDKIKEIRASKEKWVQDPAGYLLIRINRKTKSIEAGFCTNNHNLSLKVVGKHPIDIYHTLIKHGLISRLDHAADIGVELEKAYLALKYGLNYTQDSELKIKIRIGKCQN